MIRFSRDEECNIAWTAAVKVVGRWAIEGRLLRNAVGEFQSLRAPEM